MNEWIDSKEKLPADGQTVLFILSEKGGNYNRNYIFIGTFSEIEGTGLDENEGPALAPAFMLGDFPIWLEKAPYWMPIPKPPAGFVFKVTGVA